LQSTIIWHDNRQFTAGPTATPEIDNSLRKVCSKLRVGYGGHRICNDCTVMNGISVTLVSLWKNVGHLCVVVVIGTQGLRLLVENVSFININLLLILIF
jgi:hypothetical protein